MSSEPLAVPTTRIMKKTTFDGTAVVNSDAEMSSLSEQIRAECSAAVKTGKFAKPGSTVSLPLSKTRRLATLVREAKLANWTVRSKEASASPPAALVAAAGLGKDLEDVFSALSHVEIPKEVAPLKSLEQASLPGDLAEAVVLANAEAGLQLACVHLDAAAGCGPLPETGEGMGDHTVLQFVSHVVRSIFTNKGTPCIINSAALPLVSVLAALWQSAHHATACATYAATPLARRVIPLAARCLAGIPAHLPGVSEAVLAAAAASADLLMAALGQGDASLQAIAVEELAGGQAPVRAATGNAPSSANGTDALASSKGPGRKRCREKRPSAQTAALIRAVSAACFPARVHSVQDTLPAKDLQGIVLARRSLAEERAAALITGTLRRCLLGAERDSPEWMQLERLTCELLDNCTDPHWAASPLVLLSLTKGLTAVAGASRNVDMPWTQREFAVRLLGVIAAKLCKECAVTDDASCNDLLELRRWSETSKNGMQAASSSQRCTVSRRASDGRCEAGSAELEDTEEEAQRLLVHFLDAAPATTKVLWAPVINEGAKAGTSSAVTSTVEQIVLPADHTVWSSTFLLGTWAATSCQETGRKQAATARQAGKIKKQSHANKRAVAAFRSTDIGCEEQETPVASWALTTWSGRTAAKELFEGAARSLRKSDRRRDAAAPHAMRLYRRQLQQGVDSELGKARRVALEALLIQLRSSPLVFCRRQAVLGLANACSSDRTLVTSRCMAEAIKLGFTDDSSLVRSAVIDFIGRLLSGNAKDIEPQNASQLRAAVQTRLGDSASGVRRAAFRVVCDALSPEDPALMDSAVDLMQRIQHEAPRVRDPVLCALERVLFAQPLAEKVLLQLATLTANPSIRGTGLRDLFKTHRSAQAPETFTESMKFLARHAYENIQGQAATEDPTPAATILEQIALEYPTALFAHIQGVQTWLDISVEGAAPHEVLLAQHACRILADVLPEWSAKADATERKRMGRCLQKLLTPLLSAVTSNLTRGAMECLSIIATHVTEDPKAVLGHVRESFQYLSKTVGSRAALDAAGQRLLCRHAWILGTALEFLNVDELASTQERNKQTPSLPDGIADKVASILSALCLKGPVALRPSLVPCLGFLLRRHMQLLQVSPGALDVFRNGLTDGSAGAMRARTVEVLAALLGAYQRATEIEVPAGGIQDEAVAKTLLAPKVSEAVQRLATLQPQVLGALAQADAAALTNHALEVIGYFSHLGVLHPSPALSCLVSLSMAGLQEVAGAASRLIFKITEGSPQLLLNRLGSGVREAAARIKLCAREPGSSLREGWRFAGLTDLCNEQFENKRLRESFLEAMFAEVMALGNPLDDDDDNYTRLERAELLLGLLAGLPYRCEFEVAHLLKCSVKFLTLRALPLLSEGIMHSAWSSHRCSLGICAASLLLHSLCQHLCTPSEIQRMLAEGEADRALPPGFSRRLASMEIFVPMLQELATAAGDASMLRGILESHIPLDSVLLKGSSRAAALKGPASRGRKRGRPTKTGADIEDTCMQDVDMNVEQPPSKRRVTQASIRQEGPNGSAVVADEGMAASAALAGA